MIRTRSILNIYLARQYIVMLVLFILGIVGVMGLFDMLELLRRVGKVGGLDFGLVVFLSSLKMPGNALIIAPFAVLFAAMMTLQQLLKRQELIIMRAAGASIWQVLYPLFVVAFICGVMLVTVLNPIAASTKAQFRQYESQYLKKEQNIIALLNQGLWLRQNAGDGYVLLHADKVTLPNWGVTSVSVLFFGPDHRVRGRLDAPTGRLDDRAWVFETGTMTHMGQVPEVVANYRLPAGLNARELEENFSTPETVSFWEMPAFIEMMQATGFPVAALRVQYAALWLFPLLCVSLIMLAGAVMIRPPRAGGQIWAAALGVMLGFIVFFLTNFLQALGSAGQIPALLAASAPTFITLAAGMMSMFGLEDR